MTDLAMLLADKLGACGWRVERRDDSLLAEKHAIAAKWLLGSRKVKQRIVIRLDAASRELSLEETATEMAAGIPPPSFIRTGWKQQGMSYAEDRSDQGWGGGSLHHGEARQLVEALCAREGWTFRLRTGTAA